MKKKFLFLMLFMLFTLLIVSVCSVSAQDVESMSNEELTTLLMQIMQKLENTGESGETPLPAPTPTLMPTATPLPELSDDTAELEALLMQIMQKLQQGEAADTAQGTPVGTMIPVSAQEVGPKYSIWENKKLIIEGLPSYMFIQPTKPVKPEPAPNENGGTSSSGSPEPTPFDIDGNDGYDDHGCEPGCSYDCWINVYGRRECGCACG